MKAYRVFGSVLGFFMVLFNLTSLVSCKNQVCCTIDYGGGNSFQACEGDSHTTYFYSDGTTRVDSLVREMTGDTWDYIKESTIDYGGTCD